MEPLRPGDPATVVLYFQRKHVLMQGEITQITQDGVRIKVPAGEAQRRFIREGFSWIRGRHAADSPELRALLAAAALEGGGY